MYFFKANGRHMSVFLVGGSWIRPVPGLFLGSETKVFSPAHLKLQNHGIFVSFSARTILSI